MAGLLGAAYGSSSSSSSGGSAGGSAGGTGLPAAARGAQLSSSTSSSTTSSVDSAQERALEAEARLRNYGRTATSAPPSALPAASALFDQVEGVPDFLDPESTRPLAVSHTHGREVAPAAAGAEPAGSKSRVPGEQFDISRLAPALKGQKRAEPDARTAVPGAVIEGKAKKYKTEDGAPVYTDLQVAMMGGVVKAGKGAEEPSSSRPALVGPALPAAKAPGAKAPTRPMAVDEFLDKGLGAQQLPRKNQDRKDREKAKREKGQSSVHGWKTEAEMAMRQQYD